MGRHGTLHSLLRASAFQGPTTDDLPTHSVIASNFSGTAKRSWPPCALKQLWSSVSTNRDNACIFLFTDRGSRNAGVYLLAANDFTPAGAADIFAL